MLQDFWLALSHWKRKFLKSRDAVSYVHARGFKFLILQNEKMKISQAELILVITLEKNQSKTPSYLELGLFDWTISNDLFKLELFH